MVSLYLYIEIIVVLFLWRCDLTFFFLFQSQILYVTRVEEPTEQKGHCGDTVNTSVKRSLPSNVCIQSAYIRQNKKAVS